MDFEEKKKRFKQIVDIVQEANGLLENLGSRTESSAILLQFAETTDLGRDDLYDLVQTYLDPDDSGKGLEKVVINLTLDRLCKIV